MAPDSHRAEECSDAHCQEAHPIIEWCYSKSDEVPVVCSWIQGGREDVEVILGPTHDGGQDGNKQAAQRPDVNPAASSALRMASVAVVAVDLGLVSQLSVLLGFNFLVNFSVFMLFCSDTFKFKKR